MRILQKGDVLSLSPIERWLSDQIGQRRQKIAEQNGANAARPSYGGRAPGLEANQGGVRAEMAICRALNVYYELQLDGDTGYDLHLPSGETVDVKWNPHHRDLVVPVSKAQKPCDLYLLVCGNFTFGGWAPRQQVFDPGSLQDLGYGPTYVVREAALGLVLTI